MVVKGFVEKFIYVNEKNYYGVIELSGCDIEDGEIRCTGCVRGINAGEYVELTGEMGDHPSYGPQFQFQSFQVLPPDGIAAIEHYLASGTIKGIGAALAHRIVSKFGEDALRIMEEEPERLVEIKGISERIARDIAEQVIEKKDVRNAMMFLQKYGISNSLAVKIYDFYGDEMYRIMEENPYRVAEELHGVGFKTMDEIALRNGLAENSPERIQGGLIHVLGLASMEGHTYLPKELLINKTALLLNVSEEEVDIQADGLNAEKKGIVLKEDKVFLKGLFFDELMCAKRLREIVKSLWQEPSSDSKNHKLENEIAELATKYSYRLDKIQREAVRISTEQGVFILTGGPGTGKTTTICTMIRYFYEKGLDVVLAAPTGRAAKRLEEATGFAASTIHRLLEVNGALDGDGERARFQRNEDCPLEADVIIIDEMSMVDIRLFAALLKAIPNGTRLILSGDANQLPSVGPGNVLKDLIGCGYFPCITLERIYRQNEGSDIARNAAMINDGEIPELGTESKDFFFLERADKNSIYRDSVVLLRDQLPRTFHTSSKNIQVLTPMRKGNYGVEYLNRLYQNNLNPASPEKKEIVRGDCVFRLGDKVMQIRNNYDAQWIIRGKNGIRVDSDKGIFNGDVGVIQSIEENSKHMVVLFDDSKEVEYPYTQLDELELAYAVTIHKSQGSEYPAVIIPIMEGPELLFNRNLLYTAVTRASKCVIILGNREQVERMIHNDGMQKRYTDFTGRLKDYLEDIRE